jgi:hypothetical protein
MTKITKKKVGEFHKLERTNDYYIITTVLMLLIGGILVSYLTYVEDPLKYHAIFYYFLFVFIQTYGMFKGWYVRRESNILKLSLKAPDIWVHLYAPLPFFIIFLILFNLTPLQAIYFTITFLIIWEFFELTIEGIITQIAKKEVGVFSNFIRTQLPNSVRDIFMNTLGVFLSYIYVISVLRLYT